MQASVFSDVFAQIESRYNSSHSLTSIHDFGAHAAAISILNKGIDVTKQFLHTLLTRRNSHLPIFILPPEILARIFHLLVLDEPLLLGRRNLGWIGVTHVCWHWRQVALDDSSLWARIRGTTVNTKWILELLVRAKNVPLDIEFNLNTVMRASPEKLLIILPHLSHTRHLRFHGLSKPHFDDVQEICSLEAPALEYFELTAITKFSMTFRDLGENMLFKGHSPRLRTLSLSRVVIPWSIIPRGQLTHLKIAYFDEDVHSPGDLNQLIDLLVNCPALEILALESCLPSQLAEFPHGQTIHLPHLSHLHLCDSTPRISNMLKMFKLPSSTTLHLDCIPSITSNGSEGLLLPVISAQLQTPTTVEFKSLAATIGYFWASSLRIIASTSPPALRDHQTQKFGGDIEGNAKLVLSFNMQLGSGRTNDLFEQACKMLPISNLEFISVSAINTTDAIDINWVELFSCCPNVSTMLVNGHGTSSLVQALTAPTVTNAGSSRELKGRWKWKCDDRESTLVQPVSTMEHVHAGIFPKLKILGLTDLDFSEGKHPSNILFNVLERGLQQRMAASGAPLKLLRIIDCDICAEYISNLKKLVQDFQLEGWI